MIPILGLKDAEGERALAWAASHSARTLEHFDGTQFERDHDALTAIFGRPDNVPLITRCGQYLYNFCRDARNLRGLWRRTTVADYLMADPRWEPLLDLDALAASDGEEWMWGSASLERKSGKSRFRPLARRQRCGRASRIRSGAPGLLADGSGCRRPRAA